MQSCFNCWEIEAERKNFPGWRRDGTIYPRLPSGSLIKIGSFDFAENLPYQDNREWILWLCGELQNFSSFGRAANPNNDISNGVLREHQYRGQFRKAEFWTHLKFLSYRNDFNFTGFQLRFFIPSILGRIFFPWICLAYSPRTESKPYAPNFPILGWGTICVSPYLTRKSTKIKPRRDRADCSPSRKE